MSSNILLPLLPLLLAPVMGAFLTRLDPYPHQLPVLAQPPLTVASFNVQTLGTTKMARPELVNTLIKILGRFDLVSVLELRDVSGTVADLLLRRLNAVSADPYKKILGVRLGRTSIKEAYYFLYRSSKLQVEKVYQYDDPNNAFERPPMVVVWKSPSTELPRFATLAVHIKPDAVVSELEALAELVPKLQSNLSVKHLFLMGDLNSDCLYLSESAWRNLTLSNRANFHWLLPRHTDTTAHDTDCAYDNIIVPDMSPSMESYLIPGSVRTVDMEQEFGLTRAQAQEVSDHYPVEFMLRGVANPHVYQDATLQQGFQLKIRPSWLTLSDVRSVYRNPPSAPFRISVYKIDTRTDHADVTASASNITALRTLLSTLHLKYPLLLSVRHLAVVESLLPRLQSLPRVIAGVTDLTLYELSFSCSVNSSKPFECQLSVMKRRG